MSNVTWQNGNTDHDQVLGINQEFWHPDAQRPFTSYKFENRLLIGLSFKK
jgi:hypothetical protein